MAGVAGTAGGVPLASPAGVVTVVVGVVGIAVIHFLEDRQDRQRRVPSHIKPWHLGGFVATAAAMCVLVFRLDLVWFFVAALALVASSAVGWVHERRNGRRGTEPPR